MNNKIKIGISTCLLGEKVRYDGQHKLNYYLKNILGQFVEYISVCPEVECGMPIPREAMSLQGSQNDPQLYTIKTKKNLTVQMNDWINAKLPILEKENLCGFIFKTKSPSSALYDAKIHTDKGMPYGKSPGLFAKAFIERFSLIPVEDEGRLNDPVIRENFIERVFIYYRWINQVQSSSDKSTLNEFHKEHKLIIMSHAPSFTAKLGNIAGNVKKLNNEIKSEYILLLMEVLKKKSTVKKHVNVLQHILGYFKKDLTSWEKEELLKIIDNYHKQLIPLIVPLTLIQHYIRKYDKDYLKGQRYIFQHPAELKLRNHV